MGEFVEAETLAVRESLRAWQEPLLAIERLEKPVVAAINGLCAAAGSALALACDVRIAARSARIGFPSAKVGLVTDLGCSWRLPRLVGLGWAKHYLLTGDWIDAATAERIGLVTSVLDDDGFRDTALEFVSSQLAAGSLAAQAVLKRLLDTTPQGSLDAALEAERLAQAVLYGGADARAAWAALRRDA